MAGPAAAYAAPGSGVARAGGRAGDRAEPSGQILRRVFFCAFRLPRPPTHPPTPTFVLSPVYSALASSPLLYLPTVLLTYPTLPYLTSSYPQTLTHFTSFVFSNARRPYISTLSVNYPPAIQVPE